MRGKPVEKVRELLVLRGLDAILFTGRANIRYLCGFSGSEGALLVDRDASSFLTDSRYTTQAQEEVRADHLGQYRLPEEGIVARLRERGCGKIGFEGEYLVVSRLEKLRSQAGAEVEWVPLAKEMRPLRGVKSDAEIEAIRAAARLNAVAFAEIAAGIHAGVSERELAVELEFALKRRGAEEKAFDFIVASGRRGAMPHGLASQKVLSADEMVTIDFGVRLNGYHSDETVTLALGHPPQRLLEAYDVVLQAHDLALEALRPGQPLKDVDAVARDHIRSRGFGEFFGHGLGHGVGLEIHEFPVLSPRSEDVAEEGMVVTIEPGIYIPGLGGIRIEDMAVVSAHGCDLLTAVPKNLRTCVP
ncbi:MAG: aminopeptidase P family protein [Deltaproteobacteria bacterium]|nr:aminopeptidase P family protein [Deltaproteobacteria bacterium]